MSIWRTEVTPELLESLSRGTFADRIGIRITEVGADYLRATMPVTPEDFSQLLPNPDKPAENQSAPSPADLNATMPGGTNIIVGAGSNTVVFYNSSGTIGTMSVNDFNKVP